MKPTDFQVAGIFPTPIYIAQREIGLDNSGLTETEDKEIEEIIENGMMATNDTHPELRSMSEDKYIFNDKLQDIKEFCEDHIDNYVKEVHNPRKDLEFYITQSWLNYTKLGGSHGMHTHQNSWISGVFYLSAPEGNGICFYDPNMRIKRILKIDSSLENPSQWQGEKITVPLETNQLVLFPSWLGHAVDPNPEQTTTRLSLAFNVFFTGPIGIESDLTELILK
tara:strand:- start:29 stop:697 length:669 start_codon:yes stop_codon:yes gene_type:complete